MGSCLSSNKAVSPNQVAPKFDEEKDYLGQRGYSKTLISADGVDLFAYFWPATPDVPLKGIIQLVHGSIAYICFDYLKFKGPGLPNVYEGSWVEAFNQAGFSVCGLDHQGYGRSKGVRLNTKFQTHVDNLLLLRDEVADNIGTAFTKGLPYFLLGHCMGGLVATLACLKKPDKFAGLVLLSPMISVESSVVAKRLGPKLRPKSDDGDDSTTSETCIPWLMDAWATDLLVANDGGYHLGGKHMEAVLLVLGQLEAEGAMEPLALPLLVFHSERDTVADPEGARTLHERALSSDKTLRMLSKPWHVLTKEEGWEELLEETTMWLSMHATKSDAFTWGFDGGPQAEAAAAKAAVAATEDATRIASISNRNSGQEEVTGKEGRREKGGEDVEKASKGEAGDHKVSLPSCPATTAGYDSAVGTSEGEDAEEAREEVEKAERNSAPVLARSMSMLGRLPEHEPLAAGQEALGTDSLTTPARRYSFSVQLPRPLQGLGDATPSAGSATVLGPLPLLPPVGQRRTLSALPPELVSYGVRGRLPPLPPLTPLLDRKPIV